MDRAISWDWAGMMSEGATIRRIIYAERIGFGTGCYGPPAEAVNILAMGNLTWAYDVHHQFKEGRPANLISSALGDMTVPIEKPG